MYSILFLAGTSFICCLFLTPLVRKWSCRLGLVDRPDGGRKLHAFPTPRMGGIAIGISYLAALGILLLTPLRGANSVDLPVVIYLLPAAGVVFATGLLDDLVGLNPWEKLLGQVSAACLAYWGGVEVHGVAGFAAHGWWSLPVTVLWLIACANAFNLIDGGDGLAAGVGLFAAFTTLAAALLQQNATLALATAPLVGALLAFLRYNFNPASIFLGDCGSLTIGFLLGCFAAIWSQKSATLMGMTAPLMALSVPLLDTGICVVRRFLRHQPIFRPDRNHIHHRLLDRGFSPRKVALVLYAVCGLAAAFSLLATVPHNRFDGLLLVVFCAAAWVGVQLAGYVEFDAARHLVLTGTFRHILNARLFVNSFERKVAAVVTADDYWEIIRDVGREFGCAQVRMALTGTVYEERDKAREPQPCCTIRIPLSDGGYVNFKYPIESSVRHAVAISSIVEILQRTDAPATGLPVNSVAPGFSVENVAGTTVTLEMLCERGRPLLLFFSEPWCGACDAAFPEVAEWQREHADRLLIVPITRGKPQVNRAKSRKHNLHNVLVQADREIAQAYRVEGTPSAVLVSEGLIASPLAVGIDAIRALVDKATLPPPLKKGDREPALRLADLNGRTMDLATLPDRRSS